jgi:hypothetical protein
VKEESRSAVTLNGTRAGDTARLLPTLFPSLLNAALVVQITEQLLHVKIISSVIPGSARSPYGTESNISTCRWYFTRHKTYKFIPRQELERMFRLSGKISKADTAFVNIPSSVSVFQEDVTENPEFCIHVSFDLGSSSEANLPPVSWSSEAAPARHRSEPVDKGPRLNVSGEILISFPPT